MRRQTDPETVGGLSVKGYLYTWAIEASRQGEAIVVDRICSNHVTTSIFIDYKKELEVHQYGPQ